VVERAESLTSESWSVVLDGVQGTGFLQEFTDVNPRPGIFFYRVRIVQ